MNLKLILLIILIISTSIIFSTTTTKKTTKKIIKKTTHKKTTNKLIKITTKAKSNEPVSECYESYDSSYLKYENKTKCNSTCSTYKNSIGTDLVRARNCNLKKCAGAYFFAAANKTFKYDCCNTNNCNTNDKFDSLNYTCEFFKKIEPKQKLIHPSKIMSQNSVKQCYFCDDCINPERDAQIQVCQNFNELVVCQYVNDQGLWSGYCAPISEASHLTFKEIKIKAVFCQTDLCNSVENMRKIENMTLCDEGFYG